MYVTIRIIIRMIQIGIQTVMKHIIQLCIMFIILIYNNLKYAN